MTRSQLDAPREAPDEEPVIRTIAMPADTNPAGDIFGGWLMAHMDLAAGNVATRRAVHGGEKTIQWSACVCAGAGGVKVGHWIG